MGFYLVFKKTFRDMLGIKRNLAFILLGLVIPVLSLNSMWNEWTNIYNSLTLSEITQMADNSGQAYGASVKHNDSFNH